MLYKKRNFKSNQAHLPHTASICLLHTKGRGPLYYCKYTDKYNLYFQGVYSLTG